jgi:hypothetical protein
MEKKYFTLIHGVQPFRTRNIVIRDLVADTTYRLHVETSSLWTRASMVELRKQPKFWLLECSAALVPCCFIRRRLMGHMIEAYKKTSTQAASFSAYRKARNQPGRFAPGPAERRERFFDATCRSSKHTLSMHANSSALNVRDLSVAVFLVRGPENGPSNPQLCLSRPEMLFALHAFSDQIF